MVALHYSTGESQQRWHCIALRQGHRDGGIALLQWCHSDGGIALQQGLQAWCAQ